MNTTRIAILVTLLVTACDMSRDSVTESAATTSLVGTWLMHMIPEDRVITTIPPPCDGSMNVTKDDAAGIAGTWSCGAGSGTLSGFRVHESGGAWIGFGSNPGGRWLTAWVTIGAANLKGDQLTASR